MIQNHIIQVIESTPLAPGFGVFTEAESGKHLIYFVDAQSKVLLLSKPYAIERHAESALRRFEQGKFSADVCEDAQGWYLEFRSEGGKLIAASPAFAAEAEAEQALAEVQGQRRQAPDNAPVPQLAEAEAEPVAEPRPRPPRHSFRLDFYQEPQSAALRGRIEYPLTQESAVFQGLDLEAVRVFVSAHLKGPELSAERKETGEIRLPGQTAFAAGEPLEIELALELPPQETYEALVYAKSLQDNRQTLIARTRGQGGPIRLAAFTHGLDEGLYRLSASVQLEKAAMAYSMSSPLFLLMAETEVLAIA